MVRLNIPKAYSTYSVSLLVRKSLGISSWFSETKLVDWKNFAQYIAKLNEDKLDNNAYDAFCNALEQIVTKGRNHDIPLVVCNFTCNLNEWLAVCICKFRYPTKSASVS